MEYFWSILAGLAIFLGIAAALFLAFTVYIYSLKNWN